MEHLKSSLWYFWQVCTLWSGIITVLKKWMCSSLSGTANPEMMEARMSRSSGAPLNLKLSWIKV